MIKLDVNDFGLTHITLILLLHYLVKFKSHGLAIYAVNLYWVARVILEMIN